MTEAPRMMADNVTNDAVDDAIGTVESSYLEEWTSKNYEIVRRKGKPVLVRSGIIEEVSTVRKRLRIVSFGKPSRVTFEGETRVGVASLIEAFGIENVEKADAIRIRVGRELIVLSARLERRKRVELPAELRRRLTLLPGARITAQLVAQREIQDIIPVVELSSLEVYVHFDYVKEGRLLRRVNGKGRTVITMGMLAPIDIRGTREEDDFWDNLYDGMVADINDEFRDRVHAADALPSNFLPSDGVPPSTPMSPYRGFSRDGAELKRDAKREGSP